jgi:flagellar hook-basal body complex protein FliE
MNQISRLGISPPTSLGAGAGVAGTAGASDSTFKNLMIDSIDQVNSMQMNANTAVESLMTGGAVNPAEVLSAVQKADMSFRLMMQIRNKLVAAYQEIKDIRV